MENTSKAWKRELHDEDEGTLSQYIVASGERLIGFEVYPDGEMSQVVRLASEDEIPGDFEVVPLKETADLIDRLTSRSAQPA